MATSIPLIIFNKTEKDWQEYIFQDIYALSLKGNIAEALFLGLVIELTQLDIADRFFSPLFLLLTFLQLSII